MEALEAARKRLAAADHILTQSYPLIKDPKLLIAVLTNLSRAVEGAVEVSKERARRLPTEFLRLAGELQETMHEHEQSPVEFARKGAFVICDESYRIRTLNEEQLRRQLRQAKALLGLGARSGD